MRRAITIVGTGGEGYRGNIGVALNSNTVITSVDWRHLRHGSGRGGNGLAERNMGIEATDVTISSTGTGAATIAINGTGGAGTSQNYGVHLTGSQYSRNQRGRGHLNHRPGWQRVGQRQCRYPIELH